MRKSWLVAGLAAAALIPSFAAAQPSCWQQRDNQVVGTVAGAGVGALIGSAVAPRGDRGVGAVIGGVGGAVVGNQVTQPGADCAHAYGYYDQNNQWHANAIDRADARGYYDRNGAWVDGAPDGYYDGAGRWVAAGNDPSVTGYYDGHGQWIPASAGGYYDNSGQWVASVSGHYDGDGRWIAGQTNGAYDVNGRWMPGAASGHTDANGVWVANAQPGYYDSGHHWHVGPARGYYDAQGTWIVVAESAGDYGAPVSFGGGERHDVDSRVAWLQQRIQTAASSGALDRGDAAQDFQNLDSIRRQESRMRDDGAGQLSAQDEGRLQDRLNHLSDDLRASLGAGS